jgi:DNA-binding MarR family transcriptional regulator
MRAPIFWMTRQKTGGMPMATIDLHVGRSMSDMNTAGVGQSDDETSVTRSARRRPPKRLVMAGPQDIVHGLLFVLEYSNSHDPRWREHKRHLSLFFSRHGGLHLLLMLLNAYYNKPAAGRRPGWVFNGLSSRIDISERGLRMLINDAVEEGLIEQQPIDNENDRRCRSYRLMPPVIHAWEALTTNLLGSMGGIFEQFDADALANVDYRKWDPAVPARDQIDRLPPSHRLRRRQQGWPPRSVQETQDLPEHP